MAVGTIAGAEVGAQLIQMLKRAGNVNFVVSVVSIVIYFSISSFMVWESWKTLRRRKRRNSRSKYYGPAGKKDESSFTHVTEAIHRLRLWPMISLPTSGVQSISLWIIILVSFIGGLFSGFLGGGGRLYPNPKLVFVLRISTHPAGGTPLF